MTPIPLPLGPLGPLWPVFFSGSDDSADASGPMTTLDWVLIGIPIVALLAFLAYVIWDQLR